MICTQDSRSRLPSPRLRLDRRNVEMKKVETGQTWRTTGEKQEIVEMRWNEMR